MANGWTPERRVRQAKAIRRWRPWEKSTGPKTPTGKSIVANNAAKGREREKVREMARFIHEALLEQRELMRRA